MAANRFAGIDEESGPRLDLAALIDMSFLMLIFFMVSANLQRQEADLGLVLPGVSLESPSAPAAERLFIAVLDDGTVLANQDRLDAAGSGRTLPLLGARLRRHAALAERQGAEPSIVIACADGAAEQRFVDVLNACARAGIHRISLIE